MQTGLLVIIGLLFVGIGIKEYLNKYPYSENTWYE